MSLVHKIVSFTYVRLFSSTLEIRFKKHNIIKYHKCEVQKRDTHNNKEGGRYTVMLLLFGVYIRLFPVTKFKRKTRVLQFCEFLLYAPPVHTHIMTI